MQLLEYVGIFAVISTAAVGASSWAARRSPTAQNTVGFLLSAVASYATGFLLSMVVEAARHTLPAANIIAPFFTWLLVAIIGYLEARRTKATAKVLAAPWFINAGIAFAAVVLLGRVYHLAEGVPLVAIALFLARGRVAAMPARVSP
jgi:hypothetical protein